MWVPRKMWVLDPYSLWRGIVPDPVETCPLPTQVTIPNLVDLVKAT